MLILVVVFNIALNETYRSVVVKSEIKIDIYDTEVYWKIQERLQSRFEKVDATEMGSLSYSIRSGTEFFVHGDFDRAVVECYRVKEGIARLLERQNENLTKIVNKTRLKELDGWRAKITHSGIRTKDKTRKQETDLRAYEKSVRSLKLVREILDLLHSKPIKK